jgi:hypothetical protein
MSYAKAVATTVMKSLPLDMKLYTSKKEGKKQNIKKPDVENLYI